MTLPNGTRLGPYEIVSLIGAGGMGEVYRGRDTRLDRTVAIKILPAAFAAEEQLRLRFEREARAISQLSHPNICTLHDVGQATLEGATTISDAGSLVGPGSSVQYLVMEYLEGENLAERLARGRLPLDQALRLGIELASALDCAHRAGIVHRDLKPANVIVTRAGAKLVDFGLARTGYTAKARQKEETMRLESDGPLTERGTILGTWQYMAPEQLSGEEVDQRADIFALGAILYEVLTGRKAFDGSSISGLMTAVLATDPQPIRELQPQLPIALEQLVRGMLAKDRDHRVQTAHDVRLQLQWILESLSQPGSQAAPALMRPSRTGMRVAVAVAVVALLAAIAALALRPAPEPPPPPLVRFTLPPPPELGYELDLPAISPDGRQLVYSVAPLGGRAALWLRSLDRDEPRILTGTEGAHGPFFSPDGRWLGFFSGEQMKRLNLEDGTIETICEARGAGGASWGVAGVILFSPRYEGEIWRVDAAGGTPAPETEVSGKELHVWPHFLPDGTHYIYLSWSPEGGAVVARRLGSTEKTTILPIATIDEMTVARYAAGHLFFVRNQSLFAQPFDTKTLALQGSPRRIAEGLKFHGPGLTPFAVSSSGALVYLPDGYNEQSELLVLDPSGRVLQKVGDPVALSEFRVSPDGELIAASINEPLKKQSIWLIDVTRGSRTPTVDGWAESPIWLPDGSGFVFSSAKDGPPNLHRVSLGREVERISTAPGQQVPTSVTRDGLIVYETMETETKYDIRTMRQDGSDDAPFLAGRFSEESGHVSPDGRWIAFMTDESGRYEIYVTAFPRPERRWRISEQGGHAPRWSRDGRELYFLSRGRLMRSRISATDTIDASVPDVLFDIGVAGFDTMPENRFLVARRELNPSRPALRVISGWQHLAKD